MGMDGRWLNRRHGTGKRRLQRPDWYEDSHALNETENSYVSFRFNHFRLMRTLKKKKACLAHNQAL
jgi:hypothetical protein